MNLAGSHGFAVEFDIQQNTLAEGIDDPGDVPHIALVRDGPSDHLAYNTDVRFDVSAGVTVSSAASTRICRSGLREPTSLISTPVGKHPRQYVGFTVGRELWAEVRRSTISCSACTPAQSRRAANALVLVPIAVGKTRRRGDGGTQRCAYLSYQHAPHDASSREAGFFAGFPSLARVCLAVRVGAIQFHSERTIS